MRFDPLLLVSDGVHNGGTLSVRIAVPKTPGADSGFCELIDARCGSGRHPTAVLVPDLRQVPAGRGVASAEPGPVWHAPPSPQPHLPAGVTAAAGEDRTPAEPI